MLTTIVKICTYTPVSGSEDNLGVLKGIKMWLKGGRGGGEGGGGDGQNTKSPNHQIINSKGGY